MDTFTYIDLIDEKLLQDHQLNHGPNQFLHDMYQSFAIDEEKLVTLEHISYRGRFGP